MNRRNLFQQAGAAALGVLAAMVGIRPKKAEAEDHGPRVKPPPTVVGLTRTMEKWPDELGWRFKVTHSDGVDYWTDPLPFPFEDVAELDWFIMSSETTQVGEARLRPRTEKWADGSCCMYMWRKFTLRPRSWSGIQPPLPPPPLFEKMHQERRSSLVKFIQGD